MYINWIEGLLIATIVAVVGSVGFAAWAAWDASQKSTIELKNDEWACVKDEKQTRL